MECQEKNCLPLPHILLLRPCVSRTRFGRGRALVGEYVRGFIGFNNGRAIYEFCDSLVLGLVFGFARGRGILICATVVWDVEGFDGRRRGGGRDGRGGREEGEEEKEIKKNMRKRVRNEVILIVFQDTCIMLTTSENTTVNYFNAPQRAVPPLPLQDVSTKVYKLATIAQKLLAIVE